MFESSWLTGSRMDLQFSKHVDLSRTWALCLKKYKPTVFLPSQDPAECRIGTCFTTACSSAVRIYGCRQLKLSPDLLIIKEKVFGHDLKTNSLISKPFHCIETLIVLTFSQYL